MTFSNSLFGHTVLHVKGGGTAWQSKTVNISVTLAETTGSFRGHTSKSTICFADT